MDLILRPWRHYTDFQGRSTRREYFLFSLQLIVGFVLLILLMGAGAILSDPSAFGEIGIGSGLVLFLLWLVSFVPGLAVGVRRLHDSGKSGWLLLLSLLPYLGGLILLVLMLLPPDAHRNAYGADPRDPSASTDDLLRTFS